MRRSLKRAAPSPALSPITLDELIRAQLEGKLFALGRYDDILWKVRAGYVAVIYGMLGLLVGKESQLVGFVGAEGLLHSLSPITLGVSVCAMLIDLAFVVAKLRVVAARDRLSDLTANRARDRHLTDEQYTELLELLHLSGEHFTMPPLGLVIGGIWPLLIYLFAPAVMYLFIR